MANTKIRIEQVSSGSATDNYVATADGSGNTNWEEQTGGSAVGYPVFSGAKLTKSATQAITTGSEIAVTFDGEVYDTDTYHDNSTNPCRLTAPVTGYYLAGGSAEGATVGNQKYWMVRIRKGGSNDNGDGRSRVYVSAATTNPINPPFSRLVQLNAGEYVELTVEHNHGSDVNVRESINGTSFWIVRVA